MRNPNGYGSTYKLKGKRRRPWVARITTGWTTTVAKKGRYAGQEVRKQLYQTIGYFETKEQAMDALVMHRISPVSPKAHLTLEELYSEWSEFKFKNISKSTENNYKAAWKYMERLKSAKFKELRTSHWQQIITRCQAEKRSHSTMQKIRTLAYMLCEYAMENDITAKNYASFIKMPKVDKQKKERFNDLEIKALEKAAGKIPWVDTVLIMIYSGMRISEMLGLTRFNVDMGNQIITGGVKTEAGKDRLIPIHPKILKYVQAWYDKGGDALICDENGKGFTAKKYREDYYYPALEAAKVRKLTPHKCRHTFGSLAAEAGVDTIYIQQMIGHSDYAFTANEYTHPEIEALKKAMNKI